MRRSLAGMLALLAMSAAPAAAQLVEGRDFLMVPPADTWAAERWPVVVALAGPEHELQAVADQFKPLTVMRGALLVVLSMTDNDTARLQQVVNHAFRTHPAQPNSTVLVGEGPMALFCRDETLRRREDVAGFIGINTPMAMTPVAAPGPPQKAVLLVSDATYRDTGIRLRDELRRQGLQAATREVPAAELMYHVSTALTQILPPTPPRFRLHDVLTDSYLTALPGWQFDRADGMLAIARPVNATTGPVVQIFSGTLGEQTFEGYMQEARQFLAQDEIEILNEETLNEAQDGTTALAFHFVDRRAEIEYAVYWIQVGHDRRLVSFRSMAKQGELEPYLPLVRQLALATTFDKPPEGPVVEPGAQARPHEPE